MGAFTIIQNQGGQVLWVKRTDYDVWNLPGGKSDNNEPPWKTAQREVMEETGLSTRLTGLSGIYIKPVNKEMIFCFMADVTGGSLTLGSESAALSDTAIGDEPNNTLPKQLVRVADAMKHQGTTIFRSQTGSPGLEVLKLRSS